MINKLFHRNIIIKLSITIVFFFLISALWITDINFKCETSPTLLLYLFYTVILFLVPGLFITAGISISSNLERMVTALFSGIVSVSVMCFTLCSFLDIKLTSYILIIVSLFLTILAFIFRYKKIYVNLKNSKKDSIYKLLGFFIIILIVWYSYMISYSATEELIFSLDRWCDEDITTCWLNATMLILDYGDHMKTYDFINERNVLDTGPNITLGNAAISSLFLELFQISGWRFLYFTQGIFIAVFLYFIFLKRTNIVIAVLLSIICSCNPSFLK